MTLAFAIVRIAQYLSLMTLFGGEALLALFRAYLPRPPASRVPRYVYPAAGAVAFITATLWLLVTTAQIFGDAGAAFDGRAILTVATQTSFGPVFLARIALCAVLAAATLVERARMLRLFVAGLALAAIGLTSHAAASGESFKLARTLIDATHLLAAGFWIGALVELIPLAIAERASAGALVPPLRLFSSVGTIAVTALIAAGALNGIMILRAQPHLWARPYLTLLAVKIVLAAFMVALALANRFSLLPGISAGRAEAEQTLVGSVIVEFVVGVTIVVIVGFLGIMSPLTE